MWTIFEKKIIREYTVKTNAKFLKTCRKIVQNDAILHK